MRYNGGKSKLVSGIQKTIDSMRLHRSTYIEPFLGGGAVFERVAPDFDDAKCGDTHEDLVLMWKSISEGWIPPSVVTEDNYLRIKLSKPSALRGFVGFGCSFGAKWFGGYARAKKPNGEDRNFADESARACVRASESFKGRTIWHCSYSHFNDVIDEDCVVYCDPPYKGTLGYASSGADFNHDAFWKIAGEWRNRGALVLVSEFNAPNNWKEISCTDRVRSQGLERSRVLDKIFI